MNKYCVTWEMHLEANTPLEAARLALEVHRNPESIATYFQVTDDTGDSVEVDLLDD